MFELEAKLMSVEAPRVSKKTGNEYQTVFLKLDGKMCKVMVSPGSTVSPALEGARGKATFVVYVYDQQPSLRLKSFE